MFGPVNIHDTTKIKSRYNIARIIQTHMTITRKNQRHKLQKWIDQTISDHQIKGTRHEYVRAIGNAIVHGGFPIKCKIIIWNDRTMMCSIKDHGKGFDYYQLIHKFNHHDKYYQHHGYGFRCYDRNIHLLVDWKRNGRQIMLYYKYDRTCGNYS